MQPSPSLMIYFLLLSCCYSISLDPFGFQYKRCNCNVFQNQYDCDANCVGNWCIDSGCIWNGNSCQNPQCKDLKTKTACDINSKCYFDVDSNVCLIFSDCTQLDQDFNGCRGQGCYFPDPKSVTNRCQSKPYKVQGTCSGLSAISDCQSTQEQQVDCFWVNNSCAKFSCSLITKQSTCALYDTTCIYQNNLCRQAQCSDFLTQLSCEDIFDISTGQIISCVFLQNKCINPTLDQLNTQDLCSYGTSDSYYFNNATNTCQQCQGSNFGHIITAIIILIL